MLSFQIYLCFWWFFSEYGYLGCWCCYQQSWCRSLCSNWHPSIWTDVDWPLLLWQISICLSDQVFGWIKWGWRRRGLIIFKWFFSKPPTIFLLIFRSFQKFYPLFIGTCSKFVDYCQRDVNFQTILFWGAYLEISILKQLMLISSYKQMAWSFTSSTSIKLSDLLWNIFITQHASFKWSCNIVCPYEIFINLNRKEKPFWQSVRVAMQLVALSYIMSKRT